MQALREIEPKVGIWANSFEWAKGPDDSDAWLYSTPGLAGLLWDGIRNALHEAQDAGTPASVLRDIGWLLRNLNV